MTRLTLAVATALLLAGCGDDFQYSLFPDSLMTAQWKLPTTNPFESLSQIEIQRDVQGKNWDMALRAKTPSGKWVRITNDADCPVTFGGGACLWSRTKLVWLRDALVNAGTAPDPRKARDIGPFLAIVEAAIRETTSP